MDSGPHWERWKAATRLAVGLDAASEALLLKWSDEPASTVFRFTWRGISDFEAPTEDMIRLLRDKSRLVQMLLVYSYATTEAFSEDVLVHLGESKDLIQTGIESWSSKILMKVGLPWSKVRGGKLALMEASFVRNAIVHGFSHYSESEMKRCQTAKVHPHWTIGDPIPLGVDDLLSTRYSLQCFMRVLSQKLKNG